MKFLPALCLLATPLLVTADWVYTVDGKTVGSGRGPHDCASNPLRAGQKWKWNAGGTQCVLHMYGEAPEKDCTKSTRLNFDTRRPTDGGPAQTDHYFWKVSC
ncbi:hypothetical protein EJ08DRAFT_709807 [Tothia fuscella]|uniref:Secreted protein n=1 Tax=Tothia fuscella TaxID=1048955 RepID=A0A9P4NVJ4_9PEZI|nr:hypothetical protein EJ08DRAFT_709807 [Tothia fuscella]